MCIGGINDPKRYLLSGFDVADKILKVPKTANVLVFHKFPAVAENTKKIFPLVRDKKCEEGKRPFNTCRSLKIVKRFEETGKLEDGAQAGRPCLKEARAPCIAVEMEVIASEAASGTSSAREAARRLGLPPSSVRNILRGLLQLYPYKLQSCHELLPADTAQREAFAKWAFSKMEQDPTWVFKHLVER
ncbi:uncharacterized protein TNCV_360421 [Trichonephila clavipes]|nr:uncharacterized protein TNCV_360421 [Trichonephila clavipes]